MYVTPHTRENICKLDYTRRPRRVLLTCLRLFLHGGGGGEISLLIRSWPLSVVCVLSPREDESTIHFGSFGYASKRVKRREVTLRVVVIDRSYIGMCSF